MEARKTLDDVIRFNNKGLEHHDRGELKEALGMLLKVKAIIEEKAPNSLSLATIYSNIGAVYKDQGKLNEALGMYQKALVILRRDLISPHPDLVILYGRASKIASSLGKYDLAVRYADECISRNKQYKFGHYYKGLTLQKQAEAIVLGEKPEEKTSNDKLKKLNDALKSCNNALECDEGYADAMFRVIEVQKEITRITGDYKPLMAEYKRETHLPLTDYNEKLQEKYDRDIRIYKEKRHDRKRRRDRERRRNMERRRDRKRRRNRQTRGRREERIFQVKGGGHLKSKSNSQLSLVQTGATPSPTQKYKPKQI